MRNSVELFMNRCNYIIGFQSINFSQLSFDSLAKYGYGNSTKSDLVCFVALSVHIVGSDDCNLTPILHFLDFSFSMPVPDY